MYTFILIYFHSPLSILIVDKLFMHCKNLNLIKDILFINRVIELGEKNDSQNTLKIDLTSKSYANKILMIVISASLFLTFEKHIYTQKKRSF